MKKVLFFILSAETVLRAMAIILEFIFRNPYMPLFVIILNILLMIGGILIMATYFSKKLKTKNMQLFCIFDLAISIFTLYYFAHYSLIGMHWFEFPLTGNFLSILFYIFALFFSCRKSKYIRIKSDFYDSDKK